MSACLCRDHDATCQVQPVPHCHCCGEVLKPDVVLHGEPVEAMDAALAALAEADCLWVMGSSLEAGPVNQLPALARHWRMPSALVNLQLTALIAGLICARIGRLARYVQNSGKYWGLIPTDS